MTDDKDGEGIADEEQLQENKATGGRVEDSEW